MTIPPDLLASQPFVVVLLMVACATLWGLWLKERDKCGLAQEARNTEGKTAADALMEQKVLNVQSVSRIDLLEYQRDEARRQLDRCQAILDGRPPVSPERVR